MTSPPRPLRERARPLTDSELDGVGWLRVLSPADRQTAVGHLVVANAGPGERICRVGGPATFWFGVIEGLLTMSNGAARGAAAAFTGLPPGAWFGEGTLLKHASYGYDVEALRPTVVAGLPVDAFDALLERSIPFNRFVLDLLNERLGQFVAARDTGRPGHPDVRVAQQLAALFHPALHPGVGELLRITQQELGHLVGLSRQRVNEALRALQAEHLIRVEYGGVRVLDLARLRRYQPPARTA